MIIGLRYLIIILLATTLISGCAHQPIPFDAAYNQNCSITVIDTRTRKNVVDMELQHTTTFGTLETWNPITPSLESVIQSRICEDDKLSVMEIEFEVDRLLCKGHLGLTRAEGDIEMRLFFDTAERGLRRTHTTTSVYKKGGNITAADFCKQGIEQLLSNLNESIKSKL